MLIARARTIKDVVFALETDRYSPNETRCALTIRKTMIIFDLDGTLANIDHRRHFVQAPEDHCAKCYEYLMKKCPKDPEFTCECGRQPCLWKMDWHAFHEACDKDTVISPTRCLLDFIAMKGYAHTLEIWSGRCESVREKTQEWLKQKSFAFACHPFEIKLRIRPIGDYTPDDQLKERWLDELYEQTKWGSRHPVEFVFDDRPKVVRMWRRRGIFVFNCCQHDQEF